MITVIINTYPRKNRTEDLKRCLDGLLKQSEKDFCVLIVENSDSSIEIDTLLLGYCKKIKFLVTVDPIKKLSRLFNIGWKKSKTELLAYCADDTCPDKNWLKNITSDLNSDKTIAAVSGPVISQCYPSGEMHRLYLAMNKGIIGKIFIRPYIYLAMGDHPDAPGKYFESGAYSFGSALPEAVTFKKQYIDLLTTTSMGIRRLILKKVNGFDERYMFNHADGDLFLRLKTNGYNLLFDPKVVVRHFLSIGPSRNAYFIGRDTGVFHRRHLRPMQIRSFLGALLNILVLQMYWLYSAFRTNDINQLKGISGYVEGLLL